MEYIVKKIKPVFNGVLTTAETYVETAKLNGTVLLDIKKKSGTLKEIQKVIAVGDTVTAVKPGDYICVNPTRFMVKRYDKNSIQNDIDNNPVIDYRFPIVRFNDKDHLLLLTSDISYIAEEVEEVDDTPKLQDTKILV